MNIPLIRLPRFYLLGMIVYSIIGLFYLKAYLDLSQLNIQLGLMALVVSVRPDSSHKGRKLFGWVAILSALLCFVIPAKTALFITCAAAMIFLTEAFVGKMNLIPLHVVVCMSPVFDYVMNLFSFPIRLQLTRISALVLELLGTKATADGNTIVMAGKELTVDTACMGLNMLTASLLAGLILLSIRERKSGNSYKLWQIGLLFVSILALNIISNFLRITTLSYFGILPDDSMHYVTGLIFFVIYILLPAYFITGWLPVEKAENKTIQPSIPFKSQRMFNCIVATFFVAAACYVDARPYSSGFPTELNLAGYKTDTVSGNVLKLSNSSALMYIKPIPSFFSSEHHPMICWRGSGFVFTKVSTIVTAAGTVYCAQLEKKQAKLFTAWWYSNGLVHTHEQLEWRKNAMVSGKQFYLVNITATSEKSLLREIKHFMEQQHTKKLPVLMSDNSIP